MKLLLTSAGIVNDAIKNALQSLIVKPFYETNLAFIPTAANVERGDKEWLINDLNNCIKCHFKQVDIVDFSAISKEQWESRLNYADVLLFGGGNKVQIISQGEWKKFN